MAASYLGSFTVGGSLPGASAAFDTVGDALVDLHATVFAQLALLGDVESALSAQVNALADAGIAIRIPAVADFQAQLDANVDVSAALGLSISDPALYLSGLLDALVDLQANVAILLPTVTLNAQLDASAALALDFTAKIAAVDLELSALATISAAISAALDIVRNILAALTAAIQAVLGALGVSAAMQNLFAAAGAHCFLYTGPLAGLGVALDGVTGGTGIGGAVDVRVPVVLVRGDNSDGVAAVNVIFRVS